MIARLGAAHHAGRLEEELKKIRRYKLIIIYEVGYIPFDQDAANLFFQIVASRYELGAIMVTSNLPFERWSETFSDDVVAAAMIDRLLHHAEVLTLTGDSYRTRQRRERVCRRFLNSDPLLVRRVLVNVATPTGPARLTTLEKYSLSRPLAFSLEPRCHGDRESQKYTGIPSASVVAT